jgi:primosomal protein N' (replication factor Y) (superfamily II helicase)
MHIQQVSAAPPPERPAQRTGARVAADELPVARVAVDVTPPHLDRPFDYLVPADLADGAQPGVRVRVRFSGRLVDGFVLERLAASDHPGRLGFLEKVVSTEPALSAEIAVLARTVADRYAGTLGDVLRLAVPPRHARAEKAVLAAAPAQRSPVPPVDPAGWARYTAGPAFLAAVGRGAPARAVWQALPGEDWPRRLAEAAATALAAGRGSVLVVPDVGELARLDTALTAVLPPDSHLTLSADLGPETRYRRFLRIRRGEVRVVAGTRAVAFAPVADLGLAAIVDDGDDHLAEPRSPYPHAREVLMLRSVQTGCALLVAGFARTAEAALLVRSGWAHDLLPDRPTLRAAMPRIEAAGDEWATGADSAAAHARISPAAFRAAREALAAGAPVLVQVPRRGYLPGLCCDRCRRPARCRHCSGPLALRERDRPPVCRWCGIAEARFVCPACGGTALRSTAVGTRRTAEELGRAFPGVPTVTSAGDAVRATVPAEPQLVIATPGAEPVADGGYGAALLLDGWSLLSRPDLRAAEEALRRWMIAAALVRPAAAGGRVVLGADTGLPTVQALIRWDPAGHADAELAARAELGFPPAVAMASLQGSDDAVVQALDQLQGEDELLPADVEQLGPVPLADLPGGGGPVRPGAPEETRTRALLRYPQDRRRDVAAALTRLTALRSAHRGATPVRVQIDPDQLF